MAYPPLELALTASLQPLVVVLGPTASGKTALAVALAERFGGEIANCDSVTMYREFNVGTAKPTGAERARAPHHLLDCVDPDEHMSAGEYARQGRAVIREITARGKLPIVAGGSGLYLRALLEGLSGGPQRSEDLRERLRERANERGPDYLHRLLRRLDRTASENIHANDVPKLIRAIEVCLGSGRKMTEMWQAGRDPLEGFRILRLGLDPERQALYARINLRAQQMFDRGLMEETAELMKKYGEKPWALSSLGYKQAAQALKGEITRDQAVVAAQQGHRNYAKRQMTWFRREPEVHWLRGVGDDPDIQREATSLAAELIKKQE